MNDAVHTALRRWKLQDAAVLQTQDNKTVISAISLEFGPVILKWDRSGQLASEYEMLSKLAGQSACRVYAYDPEAHLLLEERICPGDPLRREKCLEVRLEALTSVFRRIHLPWGGGETYLDWLDRAAEFCQDDGVSPELREMALQARQVCRELYFRYPERLLLHGDLHHDNILRASDGTWAVIDPKGVIGPEILDLPRFLLNEAEFHPDFPSVLQLIFRIGKEFGYPEEDLLAAVFLEATLACVWFVEDGLPVKPQCLTLARDSREKLHQMNGTNGFTFR